MYRKGVSPNRPSGRRLAAVVAALCLAATALGAFALPRLAADGVPASLKPPARTQSLIEQKLEDGRCGRDHGAVVRDSGEQAPT
jgi:hypothetical protein